MTTLRIEDDLQIVSDPTSWTLQRRSVVQDSDKAKVDNIGKERWNDVGYYTSLTNAFKALVDLRIKPAHGVNGVVKKLDELHELIENIVPHLAVDLRAFELLQTENEELHSHIDKLKKLCEKVTSKDKKEAV